MDTEMSSQPHLLICCYLLSSRQYLVQGTHNAEVSTTFITLIPGCTMHAATDQQKQSGLEDLQSSPCPFRLCTNFPWLRCCKVVLERSQGMAMCQWEGFSKEEDVGTHCQSDLPSGLVDTTLHWFPPEPPLHTVLPGRFAQHSLCHYTGEAFCACRWSSV